MSRGLHTVAVAAPLWILLLGFLAGFDDFFWAAFLGVGLLIFFKLNHPKEYKEKGRQVIHFVAGVTLIYFIQVFGMRTGLVLSGLAALGLFLAAEAVKKDWNIPLVAHSLHHYERTGVRPFLGATHYAFGCFLTILLFFNNEVAVFAGLIAVAVVDSFATAVGILYGMNRLKEGKSVEGTCAGFVACYLVAGGLLAPHLAFYTALIGTAVEVSGIPLDDNFLIPLVVGGVVYIL